MLGFSETGELAELWGPIGPRIRRFRSIADPGPGDRGAITGMLVTFFAGA